MAYFPLFVDLTGKDCLVIGGGPVALRKAAALRSFGGRVTALALDFVPGWTEVEGVTLCRGELTPAALAGRDLVIAATGDRAANHAAVQLCRAEGIPVNVADSREESTFLFPALVREGEVTVGISTGGDSPAAARYLRQTIQQVIPPGFGEIAAFLGQLRPWLREELPDRAAREEAWNRLLAACLDRGGPLEPEEVAQLLELEPEGGELDEW